MTGPNRWALYLGTGVIYGYMLVPLFVIVAFSFSDKSYFVFPPTGFSFDWYVRAWESDYFLIPALRSLVLATTSTLAATMLAVPAALGVRRLRHTAWEPVIEYTIISPLIIPNLVIGVALLYYFIPLGLIDTAIGILIAHVVIVLPFMFRAILVSIYDLNRRHEEASDILGASPFMTFRRITVPSLAPGIAAGAIFSFIVSFDQFTVTLFVVQSDQVTLPIAIYNYLFDVNDPVVASVSTVLVVFGFLLTVLIQRAGWLRHLGGTGS